MFGQGNFKDYSNVLAGKVRKGFKTGDVKFGKEIKKRELGIVERDKLAKSIKSDFNTLIKKVIGEDASSGEKGRIRRLMAEFADIENPSDFRFTAKMGEADLISFKDILNSKVMQRMRKQKDLGDWLRLYNSTEKVRKLANIGKESQKEILEHLGVKDGDVMMSSLDQMKRYNAYVKSLNPKEPKKTWVDEAIALDLVGEKEALMMDKFLLGETGGKLALPVEMVIEKLGLKKLANKLFSHASQEANYVGDMVKMEANIAQHFGGGIGGSRKFNKLKDMFYLADNKRRIDRASEGLLTAKEKDFISKAFTKDAKGNETININTPEGKAIKEIDIYNKKMKKHFDSVLKEILNEAEYEAFIESNNVGWIKDGVYVTRQVTKEFKEFYNMDARQISKIVESDAIKLSRKWAEDFYKGKRASEAEIKKKATDFMGDAQEAVRAQMYDLMNFSSSRYQSRFMMKRHPKLAERYYSESKGKHIDVYETNYDATIRRYGLGMGKFLSNLEFFPEHVKLKGINFRTAKADLFQLKELRGGDKWYDFVVRNVENHLGIGKADKTYQPVQNVSNQYASMLAKLQLSSPTSGLKNLLVGSYHTAGAFGAIRFLRGMATSMSGDARRSLYETGHTEVGLRNIENQLSIFGSAGGQKLQRVLMESFPLVE